MFKRIKDFLKYWYFRYLLVTELYMVEKWERVIIHIILLVTIGILYWFNATVVLGLVKLITGITFQKEMINLDENIPSQPISNL